MTKTAILKRISFVGAGEGTDIDDLIAFQNDFPQTEIGIMVAPEETGPHYPSFKWVLECVRKMHGTPGTRGVHLCGSTIERFLKKDQELWGLGSYVHHIQLNIWHGRAPVNPEHVDAAAKELHTQYGAHIIVPVNRMNMPLANALKNPTIEFLFDQSGGTGKLPATRPDGIAGRFGIYAGGINPDNVVAENEKIKRVAGGPYGLDLESGASDANGHFSTLPCRQIMQNPNLDFSPF